MSIQNLFLTQQMRETERNYLNRMEDEQKRRERGGLFSSIGSGLGGIAGGIGGSLLGAALAPFTGGMSLALTTAALTGLGATAGSLAGSRVGLELGDGKRSDALDLGMNRSAISGREKEFSDSVKDRYRRNVNEFQDALNNRILSSAIDTGIKAAAFNYAQSALSGAEGVKAIGDGQVIDASGNVVDIPKANIAGAQAYDPAGMAGSARINPSQLPAPSVAPRVNPLLTTTNTIPNPTSINFYTTPAASTATQQQNNLLNMASLPIQQVGGAGYNQMLFD